LSTTFASIGTVSSTLNHAAIAFDRFHAISHPISYSNMTTRKVQINIVLIWIFALGITVPQIIKGLKDWPKEYTDNLVCSMSHVSYQIK
jgi:hypothetical protein